jgi:predicted PurR-regulated permease PerM
VAENEKKEVSPKEKRELKLTARRVFLDPSSPPVASIVRVVVITLLILAIYDFFKIVLFSLTTLFFIIILAIFFAYLIDPLVQLIQHPFKERHIEKIMPRALAIFVAYLIVFTVMGVAIAYLTPKIANQAREFTDKLPEYAKSFQEGLVEFNQRLDRVRISESVQKQINDKIQDFVTVTGTYLTALLGLIAIDVITYAPWLILVPILSFFFLKDVNLFRISVLRVFPSGKWRARVESVMADVNKTLAAYTRAQLISCLLIGSVCTLGFYIFGINYALLLGILAGVLEFIPLIGPLTVAITVTTVSLLQSPWKALYVIVFLITLRITHDYVTYPRIVRQGIHLHPLAVVLSVLAGEQVAGIPGVFLSIPVVALLTVIYKHILEHSGSTGLFSGLLEPKEEEKKVIDNV